MKKFSLTCERCGSSQLKRSHRQSLADFVHMAQGKYPVRCVECNHRFRANLLQMEKIPFAKCPKCFNLDLMTPSQRGYQTTFWRSFLLSLGAHRYRCDACRYNFLSFRFRDPETVWSPTNGESDNHAKQASS